MPANIARSFVQLALVVTAAGSARAEIFIERLEPPCVRRGDTTRVLLVGSEMEQATAMWTTLPGSLITTTMIGNDKPGRIWFDMTVAEDARPGLYGLRIATKSGLSNIHLFAIEDLPVVFEEESRKNGGMPTRDSSNGHFDTAQPVKLPAAVCGTLHDSDLDCFSIDVKAGQKVSFEAVGSRLGKGLDPLVTIFDESGRRVATRDNTQGLFFDNRFEHTFERAGRHVVQIRDTRFHGSPHWTYMLRIGRFPSARVVIPSTIQPGQEIALAFPELGSRTQTLNLPADFGHQESAKFDRFFFGLRDDAEDGAAWLPLTVSPLSNVLESEPNGDSDQSTGVTVPCNIHGLINSQRDNDWYRFELKKGAKLEFRTVTRDMGSPADLELVLLGPDGKEHVRRDDVDFDDARFTFNVPADGEYRLKIREVVRKGGPEYAYRVEIKERKPGFELTSDVGRMAIPRGTWQPLQLELKRLDYYNGPVELSLAGAPEGMTLKHAVIPPGENKLSAQVAVAPGTPAGVYTLQVLARGAEDENGYAPQTVASTFPLIDRKPTGRGPHGEPFELREDQRRLPPSLTDRIAVVVLPEAPFEFDIEPKVVVLPRYVETTFEINTRYKGDFAGDISFEARGGTLEQVRLRKPTTTPSIPPATVKQPSITATLTSGVNTPTTKHLVNVTATAWHEGHRVHLTRTFELDIKVAFDPTPVPAKVEVKPGDAIKVKIVANRLAPYTGPLTINLKEVEGVTAPTSLEFEAGQTERVIDLPIAKDLKPGAYKIGLSGAARINKFSETTGGGTLEIVVKKP